MKELSKRIANTAAFKWIDIFLHSIYEMFIGFIYGCMLTALLVEPLEYRWITIAFATATILVFSIVVSESMKEIRKRENKQ